MLHPTDLYGSQQKVSSFLNMGNNVCVRACVCERETGRNRVFLIIDILRTQNWKEILPAIM